MEKSGFNRRQFLKFSGAAVPALVLTNTLEASEGITSGSVSSNLDPWLYSNAGFEVPAYLSERTHELAWQMLTGQWGREMKNADFSLPSSAKELGPNMHYACAAKLVAQNAPIWIHPGALIAGSATLSEAKMHHVPLLGNLSSISHTTIGFDMVLKMGYNGLRAKIKERLSREGLDAEGKELLEAMLICLDAADIWHKRHLAELEQRIAISIGKEKETYCKVHTALKNVPENPPTTFHEAIQSLRFAFAFQKLMGNWSGLGRIDEM
ncbi:MAG: pyruvate formate lyase family protein, partial [Anaerohalosphaeraceae bacterium]